LKIFKGIEPKEEDIARMDAETMEQKSHARNSFAFTHLQELGRTLTIRLSKSPSLCKFLKRHELFLALVAPGISIGILRFLMPHLWESFVNSREPS